jgi:hypothetical protein
MLPPNQSSTERADQIFRIGPETLVGSSSVIVTGRIASYHKEITKVSQPGSDGFPLEWKVTAGLAEPVTLKGSPVSGPVAFSKVEQSFMSPAPRQDPRWQQQYGELAEGGSAVLFFSGTDAKNPQQVLPTASGEQDLAALVREIVSIQRLSSPRDRVGRWLSYLGGQPSNEGYRAALRSLVRDGASWQQLEPALRKTLTQSNLSADVRAFSFSFVAFDITQNAWQANDSAALDFLCTSFSNQSDPKLALRYLSGLSLVLRYASEQPQQASRRTLRDRTVKCLRTWASLGFSDRSLEEEYQRLSRQYSIQ